jgi:hypothetical protein
MSTSLPLLETPYTVYVPPGTKDAIVVPSLNLDAVFLTFIDEPSESVGLVLLVVVVLLLCWFLLVVEELDAEEEFEVDPDVFWLLPG